MIDVSEWMPIFLKGHFQRQRFIGEPENDNHNLN